MLDLETVATSSARTASRLLNNHDAAKVSLSTQAEHHSTHVQRVPGSELARGRGGSTTACSTRLQHECGEGRRPRGASKACTSSYTTTALASSWPWNMNATARPAATASGNT